MTYPYQKYITRIKNTPAYGGGIHRWYYIDDGRFVIEVSSCEHNKKDKNDLMNLWIKHGFMQKFLPTTLHIDTYYYTDDGSCFGYYNITHTLKEEDYGEGKKYKRKVLDFKYILEATEENINYLVNECIGLYKEGK